MTVECRYKLMRKEKRVANPSLILVPKRSQAADNFDRLSEVRTGPDPKCPESLQERFITIRFVLPSYDTVTHLRCLEEGKAESCERSLIINHSASTLNIELPVHSLHQENRFFP